MIGMKPIIKIQKDYLDLLSKYVDYLTIEKTTNAQLAYFFEEVSLFGVENMK
jgi:hypothetical protein